MRDGRLGRGANGATHSARSSSPRSASIPKHAPAPSIATDREKLARADVGSRARTLLELQRAGGNAAVTQRVAIGHHAVSRTLVQPEPTLQRQKAAPKSRLKKTAFDRTALETIKANAETRHERITDFIARSRARLQYYKTRLLNAAVVYKAAFNRHKAVLDSAETAAKDRAQLDLDNCRVCDWGRARPRSMSVEEVEQDISIEWIADLTDDDLLDENEITDHLEAIGVIGEGRVYWSEEDGYTREPPRLDVDFGAWVADEDEEDAVRAARAKLDRLPPVPASEYYEEE
jgi:hypothetical protein